MSKKIFVSPGIYTIEHDISIVSSGRIVFCAKCLNRHMSTYDEEIYCHVCNEETKVITKEELRNIKIDKLI